jgi:uncharacterized protein with LGFP repeats
MMLIAVVSVLMPTAPAPASTRVVAVTLAAPTGGGWAATRLTLAAGVRLVGARWRGDAAAVVELRVDTPIPGRWVRLDAAVTTSGETTSDPVWVGTAGRLDLRVRGAVTATAIVTVSPGRQPRVSAAARFATGTPAGVGVPQPVILSRAAWGADESIRRGQPFLFDRLGVVFIHHTDSANGYAASDVPAMIRGIYQYHVLTNGWYDIGYNYLIDAYGRIWQGRYGSITANVRGAHTEGFNTGSVGIALIGTYMTQTPTPAQLDALERLVAWRLDLAHLDPLGRASLVSGGTAKYPAGSVAAFNTISGHRDANYTDCPGDIVYADLPRIRRAVAAERFLRILNPIAAPASLDPASGPFPVAFTATLSQPAAWQVSVRDRTGATRIVAAGAGTVIHVVWDGTTPANSVPSPPPSRLSWQIDAATPTSTARPATGQFDDAATPAATTTITRVAATPGAVSPETATGDAAGVVVWDQRRAASVAVAVTDTDGNLIAILAAPASDGAGGHQAAWNGRDSNQLPVTSGHYQYVLRVAQPDGIATITTPVDVRRGVAALRAVPGVVGSRGVATITISAVRLAAVPLQLRLGERSGSRVIAQLAAAAGPVSVKIPTRTLADGRYTLTAVAWTAGGRQRLTAPILIDANPPVVAWMTATGRNGRVVIRGAISRDATLTIRAATQRFWRLAVHHGRFVIRLGLLATRNQTPLVIVIRDRLGVNQPPITLPIHRSG